jgi:hypothetical protein
VKSCSGAVGLLNPMNDLSLIEAEFGDLSQWQQCPDFWVAKPNVGLPYIATLREANTRVIGQSAGGRDITAVEYGEKEPLDATTNNLHGVLASHIFPADPTDIFHPAFYGSKRRHKPVLAIQGALHGGELTGTVAMLNLCNVIETGKDLRGKAWPRLQELARATRLILIPWLNMDGAECWPIPNTAGVPDVLYDVCTHGMRKNGEKYSYPAHKAISPIPPGETAFMGSYFNDAGANLQYDFCLSHRQPETEAWMEYYLEEKPDGVLIWHCNAGSMIGPPGYYVPAGHQHEESRIGGAVRSRLLREGFSVGRLSWAGLPGLGKPLLTQVDAVYHACGATPIMCELPTGAQSQPFCCEEMLDIGLITIEEVLLYAHTDGLRPYELWEKVKSSSPSSEI